MRACRAKEKEGHPSRLQQINSAAFLMRSSGEGTTNPSLQLCSCRPDVGRSKFHKP
jgi:hypothetical protein